MTKQSQKKSLPVGKITIGLLLIPLFYFACYPYILYSLYSPKEGDIVFQSLSRSIDLVRAIEGVTDSDYSHCGVVVQEDGIWYVNEAFGKVASVTLFDWLNRGRGFRVDAFRLKSEHSKHIEKFISSLTKYQGRPYDSRYRMDDTYIYCSELPYKAYFDATGESLGKLAKLGDLNWKPYQKIIEKYENGDVPLDREMITPINLSKSNKLHRVISLGL